MNSPESNEELANTVNASAKDEQLAYTMNASESDDQLADTMNASESDEQLADTVHVSELYDHWQIKLMHMSQMVSEQTVWLYLSHISSKCI